MHFDRIARNHAAAVSVLLALSFAAPIAAQTRNTSQPSALTGDLGTVRIDNFGRVAANYYRGAQPQGADYARLSALGIKSVINLTSDDADPSEQTMVEQAGMQYFQIPMTTHEAPTAANLEAFMRIVHDSASQPVYVHCVGGRHRTGVMTAIYRMTDEGWTAERAFAEMKQYKFGADFLHPEFKQFVYAYQPRSASAAVAVTAAVARGN